MIPGRLYPYQCMEIGDNSKGKKTGFIGEVIYISPISAFRSDQSRAVFGSSKRCRQLLCADDHDCSADTKNSSISWVYGERNVREYAIFQAFSIPKLLSEQFDFGERRSHHKNLPEADFLTLRPAALEHR